MTSTWPLIYKPNRQAKRLILRHDARNGHFILTLPPRMPQHKIDAFLQNAEPWMEKQSVDTHQRISFIPGAIIPILGNPTTLEHRPHALTRYCEHKDTKLIIYGPESCFSDQCERFLKTRALQTFRQWCDEIVADLPHSCFSKPRLTKLSIRDTKTRWGSCSSTGSISLSWRLILAPHTSARYVCIHECAHLVEMNHSQKFWSLVEMFDPDFRDHKQWLKKHGKTLFQYGP